jgi:hypothetical protein
MRCPSDNTQKIDQSTFWSPSGWHWDTHRIGWTVAGVFTLLVCILPGILIIGLAQVHQDVAHIWSDYTCALPVGVFPYDNIWNSVENMHLETTQYGVSRGRCAYMLQ